MIRLAAAMAIALSVSSSWLYAQSTELTVNTTSANVHKFPSIASPVIGKAPRGTALAVTRELGDWVKITWPDGPDGVGYVRKNVGAGASASATTAKATPAPASANAASAKTASAKTAPGKTAPTKAAPVKAAPVRAESAPAPRATTTATIDVSAEPAPQIPIATQPQPVRNPYVAPPTHFVGLGARMAGSGSTFGFGGGARAWSRGPLGAQLQVSRYAETLPLAAGRMTSMQFAPSVLVAFNDHVGSYVWVRPYVGAGGHVSRSTLSGTGAGVPSMSDTAIGMQVFGGGELTFASLPRFALSVDAGYFSSKTPFTGVELGGATFSMSGHWYLK